MRLILPLAAVACFAGYAHAADPAAPEPGQLPAQTPAQDAAQEMIQVYEEFCLVHFPDAHAVTAGAAAHHMAPAAPDAAAKILLGRPGQAWTMTTPKGRYDVAIESGARQGCAVSGEVADDAGIRASFDQLVGRFARGHALGALQEAPLQSGLVHGQNAMLQFIGATPGGGPRQAFVNMATGDGAVMHVRMTRELAPGG